MLIVVALCRRPLQGGPFRVRSGGGGRARGSGDAEEKLGAALAGLVEGDAFVPGRGGGRWIGLR